MDTGHQWMMPYCSMGSCIILPHQPCAAMHLKPFVAHIFRTSLADDDTDQYSCVDTYMHNVPHSTLHLQRQDHVATPAGFDRRIDTLDRTLIMLQCQWEDETTIPCTGHKLKRGHGTEHCMCMQERLGMAQDCSSSAELELELLQCQLAQAEAALQSERQKSAELQRQIEASQGCALLTQMELQNSMSRAERLAGLVCQAEQQRKGYDPISHAFCSSVAVSNILQSQNTVLHNL